MISLQQFKSALGAKAHEYSDDQLEELLAHMYDHVGLMFDAWKEEKFGSKYPSGDLEIVEEENRSYKI